MPCVECLKIWCFDREWRHLTLCKTKLFSIMDVLPKEGVDLMGIKSTTDRMSMKFVAARAEESNTIVAGEASTAHQ